MGVLFLSNKRKYEEKYGFVYIWYDRKHKRYYVGSHWGYEDDGYICSSRWMRKAYKRRPEDFKRRILSRIYTNKKDTLSKEQEWLSLIKEEELKGRRYYNLRKLAGNYWWSNEDSKLTVGEKISKSRTPEAKENLRQRMLANNPMKKPEIVAKRLKTYLKNEHQPWNTGLTKETCESLKISGMKGSLKKKGQPSPLKGIPVSDETKLKLQKINKDKTWCYNPETDETIHISKTDIIPDGFIQGKRKKKEIPSREILQSVMNELFTQTAASEYFNVSTKTLRNWIRENEIKCLNKVELGKIIHKGASTKHINKEKYKCRYCSMITTLGGLTRWHNENCKYK